MCSQPKCVLLAGHYAATVPGNRDRLGVFAEVKRVVSRLSFDALGLSSAKSAPNAKGVVS